MAALSGPASTMMVLRAEAIADLVTERLFTASKAYGAEDALEPVERVIGDSGTTLKPIFAMLAGNEHGLAAVRRLARLAEVALELGKTDFHSNQII